MGKSFEATVKGREREVLDYIHLHEDKPWEVEERLGYRWPTVEAWYESHRDDLSQSKGSPDHSVPVDGDICDRTISALAKFIVTSKERIAELEIQNRNLIERNRFLEDQVKNNGVVRDRELLKVFQMCQM